MRIAFVTVVFLAIAAIVPAADFDSLTDAERETFEDGCLLTAMNIAQEATPDPEALKLADVFIASPRPPYSRLWEMVRVVDNSGQSCGTSAGTDIDIASCSASEVNAIVAGSFSVLAESRFRVE